MRRARNGADERNVYIRLTPAGEELRQRAVQVPREIVCSLEFNPDQARGLLSNLHRLMEQLAGDQ